MFNKCTTEIISPERRPLWLVVVVMVGQSSRLSSRLPLLASHEHFLLPLSECTHTESNFFSLFLSRFVVEFECRLLCGFFFSSYVFVCVRKVCVFSVSFLFYLDSIRPVGCGGCHMTKYEKPSRSLRNIIYNRISMNEIVQGLPFPVPDFLL